MKIAKYIIMVIVSLSIITACTSTGDTYKGPVTTIYIGHHYPTEVAVNRDDAADLRREQREDMNARRFAEKEVLNKLGVKIEWVQYTDLTQEIPNGASTGQKFDMVRIIGGIQGDLIGKNLLQPIDQYANLFTDEDSSWIYWPKVFGHNYYLNMVLRVGPDAPLVYNIGMLNKVPALKENGKTVLPVHLWQQGKWTWSAFEEYLQKVHDYWTAEWDGRMAWCSNIPPAALLAIHSNGGHIYNDDGLGFASEETKEAIAFIDRLMAKRLLREMEGLGDQWRLQWGHSVFACLQQWLAGDMIESFNERREKLGIVPFPRPDWRDAGDPGYQQANDARDCYAVPFNVDPQRAELAVKAFREYTLSFYKKLANSEKAMDFINGEKGVNASAARMFIDISNKDYGPVMTEAWKYLGSKPQINEYAKNVSIWGYWANSVLLDSLHNVGGTGTYDTWADEKLPAAQEMIDMIQQAVNTVN